MEVDFRFWLGFALSLLNCFLSSTGFTLQRKAQLLYEQDQKNNYNGLWATGVALYVLAAVPDVVAYTLVPQVVCTTVACFRLVVVTCLAHAFLQEHVEGREVYGMAACTLGTFLCLIFGPRTEGSGEDAPAEDFYHPQVWTYLAVGLALLVVLLVVEHSAEHVCSVSHRGLHFVVLPLATGLAFALEKVFNTEIGFVHTPGSVTGVARSPLWAGMVVSIAMLGLTDFYLNLRGAARMPVQVFLPISFALATSLQFFQSVTIFGEFERMRPLHAALSISGAVISLVGALLIQPPRFKLLSHEELHNDEMELGRMPHARERLAHAQDGSEDGAE